jgi:hypothetical protein
MDKMDFPKYDVVGNPLSWVNHCEHYFRICRMPKQHYIAYASFYLTDNVQLWYHRLELNTRQSSWLWFVQLVNKRSRLPLTDNPIGELALLHQEGLVDDFS